MMLLKFLSNDGSDICYPACNSQHDLYSQLLKERFQTYTLNLSVCNQFLAQGECPATLGRNKVREIELVIKLYMASKWFGMVIFVSHS